MELTALRNSLPLLLMHTHEARATVIHQLNQQPSLFTAFVERIVHKHNFFMIMMIKIMMSQGGVACLSLDSCFSMMIKAIGLLYQVLIDNVFENLIRDFYRNSHLALDQLKGQLYCKGRIKRVVIGTTTVWILGWTDTCRSCESLSRESKALDAH